MKNLRPITKKRAVIVAHVQQGLFLNLLEKQLLALPGKIAEKKAGDQM